jgi:hypothetical protein
MKGLIMRLTTKITGVKKLENSEYELELQIVDSVNDSASLHSSLKKAETTTRRIFSEFAPKPRVGEIIVLDFAETSRTLEKLQPSAEFPVAEHGEVVSLVADFNSDGYNELFLGNRCVDAVISPIRGGTIRYLAALGREGLVDETVIHGINVKAWSGFGFGASKPGFDIAKAKFVLSKSDTAEKHSNAFVIPITAKVNGLKTTISSSMKNECPVLSSSLRIENNGKKAKQKKLAPTFQLRFRPVGGTNSALVCVDPNGKPHRFNRYPHLAVWEWEHRWHHYTGDIPAGESGFIAVHREDTGEILLISFMPGKVNRVWFDKESQLAELKIFSKPNVLGKDKKFEFEIALCPLDGMKIENGFLIGYLESEGFYQIISAGPRARNIVIDGQEISPEKVGPTLFHTRIEHKPTQIALTGGFPPLTVE